MYLATACTVFFTIIFITVEGVPQSPCSVTNGTRFACYCDKSCADFQDCCPDAMPKNEKFYEAGNSKRNPACVYSSKLRLSVSQVLNNSDRADKCEKTPIMVFKNCPTNYENTAIRLQCEEYDISQSLIYELPVYSSDTKLFRNRYCAVCNGYSSFTKAKLYKFITLPTIDKSTDPSLILKAIKAKLAFVYFSVPEWTLRACYLNSIQTCSMKDTKLSQMCEKGPTNRISCGEEIYRNEACFRCNNNDSKSANCKLPERACFKNDLMTSTKNDYTYLFDFYGLLKEPLTSNVTTKKNETESNSGSVESIVITVLTSISIFALLILIITYSVLKHFRNFAGIMTLTLSACLLIAYVVFLVSSFITPDSVGCQILGHLQHTTFLSSFVWMAIMAFDLLRSFKRSGSRGEPNSVQKYLKYSLFGWSLPCIITITCVLLDRFWPDSPVSPNFGKSKCYFNKSYALLTWMYLPVTVIILFNCIILCLLFRFFYKTAQETRRVREHVKRGMFLLCFKITTVFGAVWIFQIIAVFIQNSVLNFVLAIMVSLQGLCISLAFMLTKQTKKVVSSKFTSLHSKSSSSTNTTRLIRVTTTRTPGSSNLTIDKC